MRNFFRKIWFELSCLDFSFDLTDCVSIDVFNIMAGGDNGIEFNGSFLLLYYEPGYGYMGRAPHFTWDILYLRQFWDPINPKD